jgi:hypothetical protein
VPFAPLAVGVLERPEDPRRCVLWRVPAVNNQFAFAALVRVWPADMDTPAQAGPLAADYCHPLPLQVDTGSLVRTEAGDYNNDGFNEGRGYYVLQLDNNVARVRISGRDHLRFSPVFKLVDTANRDVWVYANGRQLKNLQRNRDGDVLFEVSGVIADEVLIEVTSLLRESAGPPGPPAPKVETKGK